MKQIILLNCMLAFLACTRLVAQTDSAFKAKGKVIVQVINRTLVESDGNTGNIGMYINRAHFGYSYQFAPGWSGTLVIDAGRPGVFGNLDVQDTAGNHLPVQYTFTEGSYYTSTLKFSYLEYRPTAKVKLQAGGILQNHYITQEKFWGYRYVLETFQDKYFHTPSADLGFIGYFTLSDWLSFDVALTNGEGFRRDQDEKATVKYATGIDFHAQGPWTARLYFDIAGFADSLKNRSRQLFSLFTGYQVPGVFRLGAEYNYHDNHLNQVNKDLSGFSVYGACNLRPKLELFGRFDYLASNVPFGLSAPWNEAGDGQAYIAGIQFIPVNNVALALNYLGWQPADPRQHFANTVAFCFEYKL